MFKLQKADVIRWTFIIIQHIEKSIYINSSYIYIYVFQALFILYLFQLLEFKFKFLRFPLKEFLLPPKLSGENEVLAPKDP